MRPRTRKNVEEALPCADTLAYLRLPLADNASSNLLRVLAPALRFLGVRGWGCECSFMYVCVAAHATAPGSKGVCLVHCYFGRSRSVVRPFRFCALLEFSLRRACSNLLSLLPSLTTSGAPRVQVAVVVAFLMAAHGMPLVEALAFASAKHKLTRLVRPRACPCPCPSGRCGWTMLHVCTLTECVCEAMFVCVCVEPAISGATSPL